MAKPSNSSEKEGRVRRVPSRKHDSQLRRPLGHSLNNRCLLPSGILLDSKQRPEVVLQSLCSDRVSGRVEVSVRGLGFSTIVLDGGNLVTDPRLILIPLEGALFRLRRLEPSASDSQHRS
ncbi:hypothetical protein J6590_075156 [Homalodisca vitripennis]|nr:hypothetical protein J6590_075156 [Homalodisca vitripennis]